MRGKKLFNGDNIYPGSWNMHTQSVDRQHEQCKEDSLSKFRYTNHVADLCHFFSRSLSTESNHLTFMMFSFFTLRTEHSSTLIRKLFYLLDQKNLIRLFYNFNSFYFSTSTFNCFFCTCTDVSHFNSKFFLKLSRSKNLYSTFKF